MELTEEIKIAARELGQSLRQDNHVRTYLEALKQTQTDPEASALEKKMYDEYEALITRQQTSEQPNQEDTRLFYELRQQVQSHPLISKRRVALGLVRPHLAEMADEISLALGVAYTTLAKPQ